MADLLGSILNSMDKPPTIANSQQKMMKKQKEEQEKQIAAEKERLRKFREKVEFEVNKFIQDPQKQKHKFETMDKVRRSITHDVADVAGLSAFSFGEEEVDRYVIIFKKEFSPSDDELLAYRKGEEWDPEKAKQSVKLKELEKQEEEERQSKSDEAETDFRNSIYKEKREKKLGKEAAKDAEKIVTPKRQFGFVPSENKRDLRSIEQTLADIRSKKQKLKEEPELKTESENLKSNT